MLRILVLIVLGYLLYRLFKRSSIRSAPRRPRVRSRGAPKPTELVQDPISKTYIPRDQAIAYEGNFFANKENLEEFKRREGIRH